MAGRRYSRILASARYHAAINNYINHLNGTTTRPSRIGQGDPRPESQMLYIVPFGVSLAANQKVPVTAAKPSWLSYQARFALRTVDTPPGQASLIVSLNEFKAARVNIKTNLAAQATLRRSGVTGLPYGSYGGKSTSIPFGRKDSTETMLEAFTEIKTALDPTISGNHQISLIREKISAA